MTGPQDRNAKGSLTEAQEWWEEQVNRTVNQVLRELVEQYFAPSLEPQGGDDQPEGEGDELIGWRPRPNEG